MPTLSHMKARRVYDRIGAWQDTQRFYEDASTEVLLRHGSFGDAHRVFELGCGTGRLARRLFDDHLSLNARYRGVDISPEMVRLARARLAPFASRGDVSLTDGDPPVTEPAASADRFVSTYVLDLLSLDDIRRVITEAHRILAPGGLVCVASLSTGVGPVSRLVASGIGWLHTRLPTLTGGCRPLELRAFLAASQWHTQHHGQIVSFGLPSEVIVAKRIGRNGTASLDPAETSHAQIQARRSDGARQE